MDTFVLITGATGFLGSHLTHAILEKGYIPVILKRKASDLSRINDILRKIKVYDIENIDKAFSEQHISVVIHTACSYGRSGEKIEDILKSNLMFGINVLESALTYNVETFINTDTLLPKNLNNYSLSKKQFVEWLKVVSDKIQVVNLKLEHMYGRGDDSKKFVPWIIQQLSNNVSEIKLTSGIQKRDFLYISDVVDAYLVILDKRKKLENFVEFDVGTGYLVSVRDFVETLYKQYLKNHPEVSTKMLFGVVPYRQGEQMEVEENVEPLKSLGWKPMVMYQDGIKKVIEEL